MVPRVSAVKQSEAVEQILTSRGIFRGLEPGMDDKQIRATAKGGKVGKDGSVEYEREREWGSDSLVVFFDQGIATSLQYRLTLPGEQDKLAREVLKALKTRFTEAHGKGSKDRKYHVWSLADDRRPTMQLSMSMSKKKQSAYADIGDYDYVPRRSELTVGFEITS